MTDDDLDRLAEKILAKLIARAAGAANEQCGMRRAVDTTPAKPLLSSAERMAKVAGALRRKGIVTNGTR